METLALGVVIGKRNAFDATSPPGLATAIDAVPGAAVRLLGTIAVSLVPLTNVVTKGVWLAPFVQCAIAPGIKPAPFILSVKPAAPGALATGDMPLMKGTGFCARTALDKASTAPRMKTAFANLAEDLNLVLAIRLSCYSVITLSAHSTSDTKIAGLPYFAPQ